MAAAAGGCYKGDLDACRRESAEKSLRLDVLEANNRDLLESLRRQEYTLEMPDLVSGGTLVVASFHGGAALSECEARIADYRAKNPRNFVPAYCRRRH